MTLRHAIVTILAAAAALAAGSVQALTCYTLYDRNDAVVYRGSFPPIDMSPEGDPQREAMRAAGQFLVFGDADTCPPVEYRFGEAGTRNLSVDNVVGGLQPMTVTRRGAPAPAPASGPAGPARGR